MAAVSKKSYNKCVIKIDCLPYGFFERELLGFFSQFGNVRRVRVARSKKTGNHKGWAYVLFDEPSVAQIASEAMDGYLMFEKRLKCRVVDADRVPEFVMKGARIVAPPHAGASTRKAAREKHVPKTKEQDKKSKSRRDKAMNARMKKLAAMGVDYDFDKKPVDTSDVHVVEDEVEIAEPSAKRPRTAASEVSTPKSPKSPKAATPAKGKKQAEEAAVTPVVAEPSAKRARNAPTAKEVATPKTSKAITPAKGKKPENNEEEKEEASEIVEPAAKRSKGAATPKTPRFPSTPANQKNKTPIPTPKTPLSNKKTPPLKSRLRSARRV